MKILLSVLIALGLTFGTIGCGSKDATAPPEAPKATEPATDAAPKTTDEAAPKADDAAKAADTKAADVEKKVDEETK